MSEYSDEYSPTVTNNDGYTSDSASSNSDISSDHKLTDYSRDSVSSSDSSSHDSEDDRMINHLQKFVIETTSYEKHPNALMTLGDAVYLTQECPRKDRDTDTGKKYKCKICDIPTEFATKEDFAKHLSNHKLSEFSIQQ